MLRTNLKLAFRHLNRHKRTALLNIIGLGIGLLAYMLIFQHLSYEWSYDRFHSQADNIYRVDSDFSSGGERLRYAANYYGMAEAMLAELPEVEDYCTFHYTDLVITTDGNNYAEESAFWVDPSFPDFFSFPLVKGQLAGALDEPKSAILSQEAAERYFGDEDPIGKTLRFGEDGELHIKAVVEVPENSHIKFNILLNGEKNIQGYRDGGGIWGWSNFYVYVRLQEGTAPAAVEAKFPSIFAKYIPDDTEDTKGHLVALSDIHLHSQAADELSAGGNAQTVAILLMVAIAIMLIGWINYINLASAQAAERGQEVGVRKVVGALRRQVIGQFFTQAVVINAFSLVIAVVALGIGRPYFEQLLGHSLSMAYATLPNTLLFGGFFVLGVIVSGLYPALLISMVKPSNALKGRLTGQLSGLWARRGLTVFQFVASILLIAGTFAVYQQVSYMQKQALGFSSEQLLVLNGPKVRGDDYQEVINPFRNSLAQLPEVEAVAASSTIPSKGYSASLSGVRRSGVPEKQGLLLDFVLFDQDFIPTYGLNLLAGRNFQFNRDSTHRSVILNERAARKLGFQNIEDAIGKFITWSSEDIPAKRRKIVGVVNDYHHKSLQEEKAALVMLYQADPRTYYSVRVKTSDIGNTITAINAVYDQFFPGNPFSHFFLDEAFQAQYEADLRMGNIMALFGGLAIIIACLGLFGLASFNALRKMKEVGIRKVLGASIQQVMLLFTKDFVWLILISNLIGLPLAYLMIRTWLQNYAYRMPINTSLFLVPAILLLIVSVLTISYHTIKTAFANPVEHLRQE